MAQQTVGPYTLVKRLAVGGMAEVFLATKAFGTAAKSVVVKRMLPEIAKDEKFRRMFLREAGILSRLSHPNVVQIFDLGETPSGELYLAMEHIDGLGLHEVMLRAWGARTPVPVELCLRAIAEAARGLGYAHELVGPDTRPLRLVHRDVSLDNLLFARNGAVKLVDFGIARAATTEILTKRGELKGKIAYMAPELLDGGDADARSDIFSLGVAAYWLLTGRRPFPGKTEVAIMKSILKDTPPRPSERNPELLPWMDAVVLGMLEKTPAKRTERAADVDATIRSEAGASFDVAADVAFLEDLLDRAPDRTSEPLVAVRRTPLSRTLDADDEPLFDAGAHALDDPSAITEMDVPPPLKVPSDDDGPPTVPVARNPPSALQRSGPLATTAPLATQAGAPQRGGPAKGALPTPRAASITLPSDVDSGGDTARLTESQIGIVKK